MHTFKFPILLPVKIDPLRKRTCITLPLNSRGFLPPSVEGLLLASYMLGIMLHSQHTRDMLLLVCCWGSLLLLPCTSISEEGKILLQIKEEVDLVGAHSLRDWNASHQNPCRWNGVHCNSFNAVTALTLTNASISGRLTSDLCDLSSLTTLEVSGNSFSGPFPNGLLKCKRLEKLDLSHNAFSGSLPNLINELSELRVLNLSHNAFSGSLPNLINELSELRVLELSSNNLSGSLPNLINELSELRVLDLSYNAFSGHVPPAFGLLPKVEALFFHSNSLRGTIPAFLGNLTTLTILTIGNNPLHPATIPKELGNLKRLQQLWLYNCNLTGNIPKSFGNLTQLDSLYLLENHLSGDIPTSLMALSKITELVLSENNLSGQIPSKIGEMSSLVRLDLGSNQLCGEIPESISNLTELDILDLTENQLTGRIPEELGNLRHLSVLQLYGNKLTGWLPQSLGTYSSISIVDVSGCGLEGPLPKNLCRAKTLYVLDVSSNNFNGSLPTFLEECESLVAAELNNNSLSGEIPAGLWGSPNLFLLYLQDNKFGGQISAAVGGAKNLFYLDISNNRFGGSIPTQVGQLQSLEGFIASHNCFSGPIPEELAGLSLITTLHLDHNFLSGKISDGVTSLKKVSDLNLADNQLTGEIPASLGAMPLLSSLDLSNNFLSGKIPSQLGSLRLNVLNVSGNQLSGPVPTALLDYPAYSFLNNPGLCDGRKMGIRSSSSSTKLLSKRLAESFLPACPSENGRSAFLKSVLGAVCGVIAFIFCCLLLSFLWAWKLKRQGLDLSQTIREILQNVEHPRISYHELFIATNGFHQANLLGASSFGSVYKGMLTNGTAVAVKVLNLNKESEKGFKAECKVLQMVRHRNLARIITVCSNFRFKFKGLVFEFLSNGSLEEHLYPDRGRVSELGLEELLNIAIDIANAVEYLHYDCYVQIVHCDIKPSNVLLDHDMTGRLTDFGIARLMGGTSTDSLTSTINLKGTVGYIAPEYGLGEKISIRGDVYSYGILLLEMFIGKRPTDEMFEGDVNLHRWVNRAFPNQIAEVVHQRLLEQGRSREVEECVVSMLRIGLLCSQDSAQARPTMRDVSTLLKTVREEWESSTNSSKILGRCRGDLLQHNNTIIKVQDSSEIQSSSTF